MKLKLSQKQIGRRIMELRKTKGLSQEDLAKSIEISRPSLAQIELGNRNVNVFELFRLSQILQFSLDEFLSHDFKTDKVLQYEQPKAEKKSDLRISVHIYRRNQRLFQNSVFGKATLHLLEKADIRLLFRKSFPKPTGFGERLIIQFIDSVVNERLVMET